MKGQLWIDNEDMFDRFGISMLDGACDGLLAFPSLKEPVQNNWPEENGTEVDLDHPVLKGREVSLSFLMNRPAEEMNRFIDFVAQPGYRVFRVPTLQREWKLRLLSQSATALSGQEAVTFTLKLADDFPLRPATRPEVDGGGVEIPHSGYSLDGVPFQRYGMVVESGREELIQPPAVKQGLSRQFCNMDGMLYDAGQMAFGSKEMTFKCCLSAVSMERFWQCYEAFLYDLIQPGEHLLTSNGLPNRYRCYYKQAGNFRLLSLDGPVAAEFSLVLACTAVSGPTRIANLMVTEEERFVMTEDERFVEVSAAPADYMPTLLRGSEPMAASVVTAGDVEIRTRRITEMPEVSAIDDLILPAVNLATGENVHLSVDLLAQVAPLAITLAGGGIYEKGSRQTVTLRWSYDREVTAQSVNGTAVDASLRTKAFEGIDRDTTFTLSATAGKLTASKSVGVSFQLKKYYGASAAAALTDAEVLALTAAWAAPQQASTRFDCRGGKYPYYILPASMAQEVQFWIDGLKNSDWQEEVRELTNASGYTESYKIFRLNNIQTGVLNIEVR